MYGRDKYGTANMGGVGQAIHDNANYNINIT